MGHTQIDSFTQNVHWTLSEYPHPLPQNVPLKIDVIFQIAALIHTVVSQMGLSDQKVVGSDVSVTTHNKMDKIHVLRSKFFRLSY